MAARKNFTLEEKLAVLAEDESSSTTKIAVCRKYGISKSTLDYWKKHLLNTENYPEDELKTQKRKRYAMLNNC
ncbi:hypothetical protein AN618_08130 [Fervidicola ferrireducens]|uniref:Transposase n=1 Tax=Fervidicola ferrireducens TaxID=520764 RepID=A0A140LB76_9FIRM|nr:helix-turn-helix domain-containing protein [Fervidicola ferrireducens]KXG77801.1 hypothetical protein AN618_08130 [Fervidicola ferrireducens]